MALSLLDGPTLIFVHDYGKSIAKYKMLMEKIKDVTLPTKVYIVKAVVFPVDTYGCESWTIMKAECHRTDAFKLWC